MDKDNRIDDFMTIELPYDSSLSIKEIKKNFLIDKELQNAFGL